MNKPNTNPRTKNSHSSIKPEMHFDFIKSNHFRVIHVDGIWGGVGPSQNIEMVLFNQRLSIPQQVTHELLIETTTASEAILGSLGPELTSKRKIRDAFIREVEADVVMTLECAKLMHKWLGEKITEAESLTNRKISGESNADISE